MRPDPSEQLPRGTRRIGSPSRSLFPKVSGSTHKADMTRASTIRIAHLELNRTFISPSQSSFQKASLYHLIKM
jgi:hypothetical protein